MYLTITSGRERKFARSVGMFVKTVPVVCVSEGVNVCDYVREMSAQLQETYRRESYPYTRLVEETGLRGEVFFVYQGSMFEGGEVEGAEAVELELDTLKFPLTLTAFPFEDSYHIRFDYDGKRYSAKDIEVLAKSLKNVIRKHDA